MPHTQTAGSASCVISSLKKVAEDIKARGYKRVTLQLPDDLLHESVSLCEEVSALLPEAKLYVLGDTTYNSLAVDEVAAQHVNGDCIIHFGHASLSPVSSIPTFFVFPSRSAPCHPVYQVLAEEMGQVAEQRGCKGALVLFDQEYEGLIAELRQLVRTTEVQLPIIFSEISARALFPSSELLTSAGGPACMPSPCSSTCCGSRGSGGSNRDCSMAASSIAKSDCVDSNTVAAYADRADIQADQEPSHPPTSNSDEVSIADELCTGSAHSGTAGGVEGHCGGLKWRLPAGVGVTDCLLFWVGPFCSAALTHLQMTFGHCHWAACDPETGQHQRGISQEVRRQLKRRYYLVERARDANIIGIVVGTLNAAGYLQVVQKLKRLVKAAGKKSYTLLVGKPNPAKLANFPEVDVFVMVADAQGVILDSHDYLAPIITPYEASLALTGRPWVGEGEYSLDMDQILKDDPEEQGAEGGGSEVGVFGEVSQLAVALTTSATLQVAKQRLAEGRDVVARTGGEYLALKRTFQGLETPLTGAEVKPAEKAVEGRRGRAAVYQDEPGHV